MNYFVSFDLSVLPHHQHDPRRQRSTTSKYFWEWWVTFLDSALVFWCSKWQRSRFPCLFLWHPMSGWARIKINYLSSTAEVLIHSKCWKYGFNYSWNVMPASGQQKRQVKFWAPVPLSLLCTQLSFAVSPPLGSWEGEKKIRHPKNMKYHVSAGCVWGSWVLSVWKVRPYEIPVVDFLDRGLCNWMVHLFSQYKF